MCGEVYQSSTAEQCCSNNNDPQQRTANTAELSNLNPTAELSNGLAPCPAAPDQAQLPVPVPAGVREAAAGHLGRCSSAVSAQVPGYPPPRVWGPASASPGLVRVCCAPALHGFSHSGRLSRQTQRHQPDWTSPPETCWPYTRRRALSPAGVAHVTWDVATGRGKS